jgi:Transposase
MMIIGCDYHPGFQQIAFVDTDTGELRELRLEHSQEAERFYRDAQERGIKVRVGMEASGQARWFERLLAELQFELWIGDAAEIRTKRVRKQKTDRRDAQLILQLLMENRFPRIWVPSWENRDVRQLLWHRQRMVQARMRPMNQLQAVALNEGVRRKKGLWREAGRKQLEGFALAPWASRRRRDLVELLDRLNPMITELTQAVEQEANRSSGGAAIGDPSGSRPPDCPGVCADHRASGTVSLWQAGSELSRAGAGRRVQRGSATTRTHQQAGQSVATLLAGGSGAGHGAQRPGVAAQVFSSGVATGKKNRKSRHGTAFGGSPVLDVAAGMGLRAMEEVGSARGPARNRRWCAVRTPS